MKKMLALLKVVCKEPMVPSTPLPTTFALWLFWSFIANRCLRRKVGENLASQPVRKRPLSLWLRREQRRLLSFSR